MSETALLVRFTESQFVISADHFIFHFSKIKSLDLARDVDVVNSSVWTGVGGWGNGGETTGLFRVILVKDQILFSLNPYII